MEETPHRSRVNLPLIRIPRRRANCNERRDETFAKSLTESPGGSIVGCNRLYPFDDEANVEQVNATILIVLLSVGLWVVWWLWAVNWQRLWPVLARGAWAPAVLLLLMSTVVWSRLVPGHFAWQLGMVAALACLALFCGWLQGRLHWTPREVSVEPPAVSDDGHGHSH
jgi:hypothetical protein